MNSESAPKRIKKTHDLDALVLTARIRALYSTTRPTEAAPPSESHVMIEDTKEHDIDETCWCGPELVHQCDESLVYRHRRVN